MARSKSPFYYLFIFVIVVGFHDLLHAFWWKQRYWVFCFVLFICLFL